MIENLSPDMAEMIISESITTDQLKRALKTMSRITISDDRLQHQHDEFMKLWQQINDAIQQNTEEWKAENLSLIERVAGRAQELIQMFEHELERTLLQESESQEPQAQTTGMSNNELPSWGEQSIETLHDADQLMNTINLLGSADVIQIEGADSSNVTPSLQMEQEDHDDPVNDNINVIIEQMRAPPAANQVQPNVSQQMISSPNDGQQPGTSSASQAVVPQITPHQENLEQLNRITMMVATDNNFTLKQLFMYNRCMNELQTIPSMGNSPTQQGFRDVREFITGFIEKMSKLRVSANHYEPFLMGRVISVLSPTVVTQWGLQTIKGPAGLAQLREFLTNFEEIMIDGWNQEMASFEIPPAVEPEIDYSKTGAKPKQKPKDSVEKSDDNWSLPSRSGANTPTGATYLRTQPRFNKKDVAKASGQPTIERTKRTIRSEGSRTKMFGLRW